MKALVIVANGMHLGYLGCYGNDWVDTPALDELAAASVVFDQHIADAPDAAGARRSWRRGRYHFPGLASTSAPSPDLLDLLRQNEVPTFLLIDAGRPHDADFTAGWDDVAQIAGDDEETSLVRTLEAALDTVDQCSDDEDWLIWVELATLRPPWDVPEEFRDRYFEEEAEDDAEAPLSPLPDPTPGPCDTADDTFARLQRSYAGAVTFLDAGIAMLLEELQARELLDDLLLVLTSDHGLPLGEHGVIGLTRPWLHDELIHVPLLLRLPQQAEAGRRVFALTQAVDLFPTLLDAFGVPLPEAHGHSLLPLARGQQEQVRAYACAGAQLDEAVEWVLRTSEWSFLLPVSVGWERRTAQLYVKPDDRWEVNDLVQHHIEWVEQIERTLRDFVTATQQSGALQAPPLPAEDGSMEP